jgi:hypothetical protein
LAASRNGRLAAVDPEPLRRRCACFPRGAKTWWPSAPGRSTACMGSCGASSPAGHQGSSGPPSRTHLARHTAPGLLGSPSPAVGFGDFGRRPDAGSNDR